VTSINLAGLPKIPKPGRG